MKKMFISFFVLIFFTSFSGCGSSSSSSTTTGQTSPDLTQEEGEASVALVTTEINLNTALSGGLSGSSLIKNLYDVDDFNVSIPCELGGTIDIGRSGTGDDVTYMASFDNCVIPIDESVTGEGQAFYLGLTSGTIIIEDSTVSYNDIQVQMVPLDGHVAITTCTLNGATTGADSTVSYDMTGVCNSYTIHHTGALSYNYTGGHFLITGSAHYAVEGGSSDQSVWCAYVDFDATTATCSDYVEACGLSPDSFCL